MNVEILCCVDNGTPTDLALTAAIQLAQSLRASLLLLCVNPLLPGRGSPMCMWADSHVSAMLENAERKARWAGLPEVTQIRGRALDVAEAIVAQADECDVDYIVLGTRDRNSVARALGGSVSRAVIARANCPVLIVRRLRERRRRRRSGGVREPNVLRDLVSAASIAVP